MEPRPGRLHGTDPDAHWHWPFTQTPFIGGEHPPWPVHAWPARQVLLGPHVEPCGQQVAPQGTLGARQTQEPFWQVSLAGQVAHAAPAVPQVPLDWPAYGTQALPLQQPLGQPAPLQTQVPLWQVWPEAQHATS